MKAIAIAVLVLVVAIVAGWPRYEVSEPLTPLISAAKSGNIDEVNRLLASGTDVNERRGSHTEFAHILAHEVTDQLHGETALLYAIERGHSELVRLLVEAGADIEIIDSRGGDVWHYAYEGIYMVQNPEIFELLLELGAGPIPDGIAQASALRSGQLGSLDLIEYFLTLTPIRETIKSSIYCDSAKHGRIQIIEYLRQEFGGFPEGILSCVVGQPNARSIDTLRYLLDHGADPNGSRSTPLNTVMFVERRGPWLSIVRLLLDSGANPKRRDSNGRDAFDVIEFRRKRAQELGVAVSPLYDQAAELVNSYAENFEGSD